MNSILDDDTKFRKVTFKKKNKELGYLLDKQEEIVTLLKELKDSNVITDSIFDNLKPCGSYPGVLYGLCKVHKGVKSGDESPPFRPTLSAINTPSYKIAKFLVPLLADLTKNKYVSKDSFEFTKNVRNQNPAFLWFLFSPMYLTMKLKTLVKKNFLEDKRSIMDFLENNLKNY